MEGCSTEEKRKGAEAWTSGALDGLACVLCMFQLCVCDNSDVGILFCLVVRTALPPVDFGDTNIHIARDPVAESSRGGADVSQHP